MRLDGLLRENETETRTRNAALARSVTAKELREDLSLLLARDSETRIPYPNPRFTSDEGRAQFHAPTVRGVLDCVRKKVADDLREPVTIGFDDELVLRRREH